MKSLHIIFVLLLTSTLFAQNETNNWCFGYNAAITFSAGAPQALPSVTNLQAIYGTSSVSDSAGNLLFYVRGGDLVYNRLFDTMANGSAIGQGSAMQSSLIFRKSGSKYYIVSHSIAYYFYPVPKPSMMTYAIVDMNLAAGLGSVIAMNQSITPVDMPFVAKMAATKHCNGTDHWLMFHEGGWPGSTNYHAYLLTANGFSNNPVVSNIGANQTQGHYHPSNGFYYGMHKFSPNGRKLCATFACQRVELYDFDNSTGILSNKVVLDSSAVPNCTPTPGDPLPVGIEFSADGSKLYITYDGNHARICQFDLCAGSPAAIRASKTIIDSTFGGGPPGYSSLQLAKDRKIYMCGTHSVSLGCIAAPAQSGTLCNYVPVAVQLATFSVLPYFALATCGLPAFESNYFEDKPVLPPLQGTITCGQANFIAPTLCAMAGYSVSNYHWNFGDSLSGNSNTAVASNAQHAFSANGTYTVKLALNYWPCGTDTLKHVVVIAGLPSITVTGKTTICKGESTKLNLYGADTYSMNGLTTSTQTVLQPTTTTTYTFATTDVTSGCSSKTAVKLKVLPCTQLSIVENLDGTKIFPIPASDQLIVKIDYAAEIKLYSQDGKLLYTRYSAPGELAIDVKDFAAGIYTLKLTSESKLSRSYKIIVSHE